MKMKKVFAALLSAMLVFAFAACSNGSSDSGGSSNTGDKPGAGDKPSSGTTEITEIETTGTVSSTTVVLTDDNETAKIAVDDSSYYIFTAAEKTESNISQNVRAAIVDTTKGGTWKFYKDNKLVYEGTYKGDIAELSKIAGTTSVETSEGLKLELTVTAVADDAGDLYEISTEAEEATFTFEIKSSDDDSSFTFEAEIPAVTVSETPAFTGINVGDGPYFVKCGEYYFFSGVEKKWIDWLEDDVVMPDGTIIKIDYTLDGYNINLTKDALDYIMDLVGIDYIVLYKKGVQTGLDTKEFDEFKSKLTVNTHYTVKDDIFVILTDEGYMTAKTTGILRNFENNENGSEHGGSNDEESADAMITVMSAENLASIDYMNNESSLMRGFTTLRDDHLDGIVHITNTINEIETPSESIKANGVLGYIFNLKKDDDNKFSFSIAGFRYNQYTQKTEAYVETYKNVTADELTGSLPAGNHATGESWGPYDFGFELGNISPSSGKIDIWIDVVANDGVTNGRKGTAGTYTVKFFDSDPKRIDSDDNSVGYSTTLQPLATLVVAASDVSNPYSSSLADMTSKVGCYANIQGYQKLTGKWQFTF